jgi:hypothetical protein
MGGEISKGFGWSHLFGIESKVKPVADRLETKQIPNK